jgi:hypothetical protein
MATQLTVQTDISDFTYTAADATGNTFDNSTGDVYFFVFNAGATPITATVAEQRTCNFGHATTDAQFTCGFGGFDFITVLGPFDVLRFNNSSRLVTVTYSSVTNVTVAAVRG